MSKTKPYPAYVIGIDPGMEASGWCMYDTKAKEIVELDYIPLWELFAAMVYFTAESYIGPIGKWETGPVHFAIENSNLTTATFKGHGSHQSVGKNKAISEQIVRYAKHLRVDFTELPPAGYSKIYKNVKVFQADTGCILRSNEHNRAAAAMAIKVAERLKIEMK